MTTLRYSGELVILSCWCGIAHAIPDDLRSYQLREQDAGRNFSVYCPLGHQYVPKGPSRLERERRSREAADARATALRDQLAAAERSKAAIKGQLTKARKRAVNGVCPCCSRTFVNVQRHMATKHPEQVT